MARKRRKRQLKRRGRRSRRSTNRVLIGLGLGLALLYFAFTKVFFDPFEEGQRDFSLLAPREVDLYMRREALGSDFSGRGTGLPLPRVFERLRRTTEWKALERSTWWQGLEWPDELSQLTDELSPQLAELPMGLDLLADGLGQEIVLLGRDLAGETPAWALLSRLSNRGKLAVDLFGYDGVLESALPGATQETVQDATIPAVRYVRLTLADGSQWSYARETDLLVAGADEKLVRDVLELVHTRSENSMAHSRIFAEHMPPPPGNAERDFSAGFSLAAGTLLEAWGLAPDPAVPSEDALANILSQVVDTRVLQNLVGRVELKPGAASVRMHADVDVGKASLDRGGLLGEPAFAVHKRLLDILGMLPRDVAAAVTLNVDLRQFLTKVCEGFGPEVRRLVNDTLRDVSRFTPGFGADTLPKLVSELARAFGDQITVAVRPSAHPVPEGAQPLPAMAFMLQLTNADAWLRIEDAFLRAHDVYGVSSDAMKLLDEGVGKRKFLLFEDQTIDAIAYIVLDDETLVLTTDNDYLEEIVQVYTGHRNALARNPDVRGLIAQFERGGAADARANAAVWVASKPLADILEPYGAWIADMDTILDFGVERVRLRRQLINRDYPDHRETEMLPEDLEAELNQALDAQIDALESDRQRDTIPALAAEWLAGFDWLPLVDQAVLSLRLGERSADLELRVEGVGG